MFETACAWTAASSSSMRISTAASARWRRSRLQPPVRRAPTMRALIVETVRRNGLGNAYIKWIVTRGVNGRPLMDPAGCVANLIILVQPYINRATDERAAAGLRLKTVAVRRPLGPGARPADQEPQLPEPRAGQDGGEERPAPTRRCCSTATAASARRPAATSSSFKGRSCARRATTSCAASRARRDRDRAALGLTAEEARPRALRRLHGRRGRHLSAPRAACCRWRSSTAARSASGSPARPSARWRRPTRGCSTRRNTAPTSGSNCRRLSSFLPSRTQ